MAFDIVDYKRHAARLEHGDLDLSGFRYRPLSPDGLRCLRYMHDVELHTVLYLRDLLLTPANLDPDVTAFLGCWVYEEQFHGEAIGDVLAMHDEPSGNDRVAPMRRSLGARDRIRPVTTLLGSSLLGDDFIALHMSWGAINEWTTQAGYSRLVRREGHPLLTELLTRIMKQEGRHIDFYASEAARRLGRSRKARRATRLALRYLWRPVGTGVMPPEETAFLTRHLFSGDDGREVAERIDRRVDRLPGLAGLQLCTSATGHAPTRGRAWLS